ncbi:hypothetical protein BV22DRAFT_769762 [Leucogyrophana mollusca]|uniref:Uncharacterized protein n=1 Tax=Leucogyrophana mollusca TaxID=85980 RepID=A0ACB8B6Q3_9AGAM|nr:hypothetical protein BV22DRAFT_769762 [Leucogyrophana mollusca]
MPWHKARDWASSVEYSTLFHSGLRAISRRPPPQSQAIAVTPPAEKRSRRSSVISLSSRLLRRGNRTGKDSQSPASSASSSHPASRTEKAVRARPSSMFVRSTKELSDLWSAGGNLFPGDESQKFMQDNLDEILPRMADHVDPFSSSPGSRSFFVTLGDQASPNANRQSFLSLSSNSPEILQRPLPRRGRPISTQTMPLPSSRSSVRHRSRDRRERFDSAWMLEESSPELAAQEDSDHIDILDLTFDGGDEADWRQFHVNWLQNDPSFQPTVDA